MLRIEQTANTVFTIEYDQGLATLSVDDDGAWQLNYPTDRPQESGSLRIGWANNSDEYDSNITLPEALKRCLSFLVF